MSNEQSKIEIKKLYHLHASVWLRYLGRSPTEIWVWWKLCIAWKPKYTYGNFGIQLQSFSTRVSRKQRAAALKCFSIWSSFTPKLRTHTAPQLVICSKGKKGTVWVQQSRVWGSYEKCVSISSQSEYSWNECASDTLEPLRKRKERDCLLWPSWLRVIEKPIKAQILSLGRQGDQNMCPILWTLRALLKGPESVLHEKGHWLEGRMHWLSGGSWGQRVGWHVILEPENGRHSDRDTGESRRL